MTNENLIKGALMLGGGFALFMLAKPKNPLAVAVSSSPAKSFDSKTSTVPTDPKNAEIVAMAYGEAMRAGEPPAKLTELNKECMKDYGMRSYMAADGKLVVTDVSGNIILSK
jgi:hypothetical protein